MTTPKGSWFRIFRLECDLCDRFATWQHPQGGLRCDACPKPESVAEQMRRSSMLRPLQSLDEQMRRRDP